MIDDQYCARVGKDGIIRGNDLHSASAKSTATTVVPSEPSDKDLTKSLMSKSSKPIFIGGREPSEPPTVEDGKKKLKAMASRHSIRTTIGNEVSGDTAAQNEMMKDFDGEGSTW